MPAMKQPGKPDTGNPFVRFDEERSGKRGTGNYGQFNPLPATSLTLPTAAAPLSFRLSYEV